MEIIKKGKKELTYYELDNGFIIYAESDIGDDCIDIYLEHKDCATREFVHGAQMEMSAVEGMIFCDSFDSDFEDYKKENNITN